MTEGQLMQKGDALARSCASARILESQINWVLQHLKRHRDVQATRQLLDTLPRSPFASRSRSTADQLANLQRLVKPELSSQRTWQQAATVVGWAKRLLPVYKPRRN